MFSFFSVLPSQTHIGEKAPLTRNALFDPVLVVATTALNTAHKKKPDHRRAIGLQMLSCDRLENTQNTLPPLTSTMTWHWCCWHVIEATAHATTIVSKALTTSVFVNLICHSL